MTVSLTKQSPDEWLLERFDKQGVVLRARHTHAPPILKLLDDHRSPECDPIIGSGCRYWSGAASWPVPRGPWDITQQREAA